MKNYILLLLFFPLLVRAQCDLELLDVDFYEGTYTIAFNNTNGCGGSGGPDGVSEIQIGFQAVDPEDSCSAMNQGWTFPSGITIPGDNNHPGWVFSSTSAEWPPSNWTNLWDDWPWDIDPPYYTGDTITFPLYNQYQNDCSPGAFWSMNLTCQLQDALLFWIDEGLSIQAVIWQISYGPTMYAEDGGWAEVGSNGDGTSTGVGLYEDNNFLDNWLIFGPCGEAFPEIVYDTVYIELPPDTVVEYVYDTTYVELPSDTVYVTEYDTITEILPVVTFVYDTTYIELPADTVYITELDTLFLTLPPDTVFVYDTITEILPVVTFVYDTTYIELPPDTLYITETDTVVVTDTIPVAINWYFYDTTYIYVTDTLIEYVQLPADTVLLTEYDTTYIYVTDTVTLTETIMQVDTVVDVEFVYLTDTLVLDCTTGEPCIEVLTVECIGSDLYIPNSFTPNNDGLNDVWEVVYDPECWENVTFTISNRWGATIYWGSGDDLVWDGSVHGGSHYVADGTYVYTCTAKSVESAEIVQESGYITVFR